MEPRELPVVVALAALSATLVLAFGQVFESSSFVAPVLAAALVPHLIGVITRWRRLSDVLSWVSSAAGLVIFATFIAPGTGSPASVVDRLSGGWKAMTSDTVPIRATHGAVLIAVLVVWIAAAVADDLAFRRHASLGAVAPGLMVVIWIAALGTDDGQWLVIGAFGAAAIVFLALQHQLLLDHRRTLIGPLSMVHAPRLLAAGAIVGTLAVVVGVAIAPALPGGDKPLFNTDGLGNDHAGDSYRTSVPPLLDIGAKLNRGDEQQLFTVRASRADYWRTVALDDYRSVGGGQWTLTAEGDEAVAESLDGSEALSPLEQRYKVGPLGERWMPAAFEPVSVSRDDILVVRSSSTLVTSRPSVNGLRYTVVSDAPPPEVSADQAEGSAVPIPSELERFTTLPGDFPTSVVDLAHEITDGLATPLDKALALRNYFRAEGGFTYDPTISLDDTESSIEQFLTTKRGFCVQFASAYATMARAIGIPARVAVGFTPGEPRDGAFEVTNWDAHAWPEVWLGETIGWTHAFDPTPQSEQPGGSELPGEPNIGAAATPPPTSVTEGTTAGTTPVTTPGTTPVTTPQGGVTIDPTPSTADDTSAVPWLLALLLAIIVVVLAPIVIVAGLKASRRSQRRGQTDPGAAIAGAWAEALDDLADRRLIWPASATPLEVAEQVSPVTGDATAPPMRALADAYTSARYGDARPTPEAARSAWEHFDELHEALDASTTRRGRLRARLDPATLRRNRARTVSPSSRTARGEPLPQPDPAGWSKPRSPSTKD